MVNSFHFLCVEIHLSLFCSLRSITIHTVSPTCCLNPDTTILRVCQAWNGNTRCATVSCIFAQPGVYPIFLRMSCEIIMFRGTGRSLTGKNGGSSRLNIGRGRSDKTSLKTPVATHGELLIASKSSNVVSSGIAFTALDLTTPFVPQHVRLYGIIFPATCPGATSPS